MIRCRLKDFQQTNGIACIETKEDLFFIYAEDGKINANKLKSAIGNTIFIEGIDLNDEYCMVGSVAITNIYNNDYKPLYTAKKPISSLLYF